MDEELRVKLEPEGVKDPGKRLRKHLRQIVDLLNAMADVILYLRRPPQTEDKTTQTWLS